MREEVEDPVDKSDEFLPQIAGMVLAAVLAEALRLAAVQTDKPDAGDPAVFRRAASAGGGHGQPLVDDVFLLRVRIKDQLLQLFIY